MGFLLCPKCSRALHVRCPVCDSDELAHLTAERDALKAENVALAEALEEILEDWGQCDADDLAKEAGIFERTKEALAKHRP